MKKSNILFQRLSCAAPLVFGVLFSGASKAGAVTPETAVSQSTGVAQSYEERVGNLEETVKELDDDQSKLKALVDSSKAGNTRFLLTGYAATGFSSGNAGHSTFSQGFNPILLWKLDDRIFFESELNISLQDAATVTELEYGQMLYFFNDYLTLGAGKFLTPLGTFAERIHPAWINKLPDFPLPFREDGGISPFSLLGIKAGGAVAVGTAKLDYALHLSNGPRLNLGATDPMDAGKLDFDNHTDNNNNKALGGRAGFLPIPELEIGYSFLRGRVGPEQAPFQDVGALLQAADFGYSQTLEPLQGGVDVQAQWVWSHVDSADYGAGSFTNNRQGGYVQLAYRPSLLKQKTLRNLEAIGRYDALRVPNGGNMEYEKRWTWGADYWLGPSFVVKLAYQADRGGINHLDNDTLLGQIALGF